MKKIFFMLVLLSIVLLSCKSSSDISKLNNSDQNTTQMENNENLGQTTENDRINDKSFQEPITNFSFNLFKELSIKNPNKNISFSPISVNSAMAMVYAGAKGQTSKEISDVIGFNSNRNEFLKEFSKYYNDIEGLSTIEEIEFAIANRVYIEKTYKVLDEYIKNITNYFNGGFVNADFRKQADTERKNINKFVYDLTKERIRDILEDGSIDASTKLVLVNAVYLKSYWKSPFNEDLTKSKDFFSTPETSSKANFMAKIFSNIRYTENEDYQAIELEYTTDKVSLLIILPRESNISDIVSKIPDSEQYYQICQNLRAARVNVELPKFKTESSHKLVSDMQKLGIKSAFSNANFSGISKNNDLTISDIFHKVFFEINEKGSEAAASTAVVFRFTSAQPGQEIPFIANHPFIYILKENTYNTPLFIGQYVKP